VTDDGGSALSVPKSVVVDPAFTWGDDRHPRTPWHRTVIYEVHVKGFTKKHPEVPEADRGKYSGLSFQLLEDALRLCGIDQRRNKFYCNQPSVIFGML